LGLKERGCSKGEKVKKRGNPRGTSNATHRKRKKKRVEKDEDGGTWLGPKNKNGGSKNVKAVKTGKERKPPIDNEGTGGEA